MPPLGFRRSAAAAVPADGNSITLVDDTLLMRRQDALGAYDPTVKFAASAIATFPNLAGTGIASVWGFTVDCDLNSGTIEWQLSKDDGSNWLFWGGASWDAAGAGDWNTADDIRTNIATFPLGKSVVRGIRIQVRLKPDIKLKKTPVIRDVWLLVEFDHDPVTDVMRTVRTALASVRIPAYLQEKSKGTGKVALKVDPFGFTLDQGLPIKAYNITDEAGRGTDLFQSYSAANQEVTLSAAQDAGDVIQLEFSLSCPVVLVPRTFLYKTTIPSIEVQLDADEDEEQSGGLVLEFNSKTKKGRERIGPRYLTISSKITVVDRDQERSVQMANAVRDHLREKAVVSLATGQEWDVAGISGMGERISLGDGVHSPSVDATLWVREDSGAYTSSDLATSITARVTAAPTGVWYGETAVKTA